MNDWSPFVELVHAHRRFVLTSHVRPDCDALGSELALALALESLGKEVRIINASPVPPGYRFLDPGGRLKQLGADIAPEELADCEVLVVLDTSAWVQLGAMEEIVRRTPARKVVIDHHISGEDLGAVEVKDVSAEATGRLVVEAVDALDVKITAEMAQLLFAALTTDTGWFRFSSTSSATLRLAARLLDAGAVPELLYGQLYEQDNLSRIRLVGRAMARAEADLDGRLIHTYLELRDFEAAGAHPSESEDIINKTLAVQGTEAAVLLVEQPGGGFKVSFRSRCELDCSAVAEQFGGGGHRKAAGAFVDEPLADTKSRVLDAMRRAMG